jgi:putative sterol carrier protein
MTLDAFSTEWALAWCGALNASAEYRSAAADWEGSVALVMTADAAAGVPDSRGVYLDVGRGACNGARTADAADLDAAAYVIEAAPDVWRDLLTGRAAPLMALMTGRLRLTRGSITALLPFAGAARELVASASSIPVRFPDDA